LRNLRYAGDLMAELATFILAGATEVPAGAHPGEAGRDAQRADPVRCRLPGSSRTVFDHCGLRGADFTGRDLSGVTFAHCRLHGARGTPAATAGESPPQISRCSVTAPAVAALRNCLPGWNGPTMPACPRPSCTTAPATSTTRPTRGAAVT
jgi:hypothetical protein